MEARFALSANGEHEDDVDFRHVPVQRDIALRIVADDQFTHRLSCGPPDQRATGQYVDGLDDRIDASMRIDRVMRKQMRDDPVEVLDHIFGELDLRHAQRASFLPIGLRAVAPVARLSR